VAKRRNFLSDSDVTTLRRLIADVETLRAQIRTLHERDGKQKRGGAHYLMKAPSGGVPAATGSPLAPGSADCLIHYREGDPKTIHDTTRPEVVYNATETAISGNAIFLAHRDAWGDLWVEQVSGCPEIDLSPGSYPAVAGASIAGGAVGAVVYDGKVVDAINQSECSVRMGDLVGLHVSPTCESFFVPCVCNCNPGPQDCCDRFASLCINNQVKIISVDGGSASWDLSECCECEGATLTILLACVTNTVTASWDYECGATTDSGTFDLSGLCDDPVVEYDDTITMGGCDVRIIASTEAEACDECEPTPPPPPCTCCFELVPWTEGECDKSEVPGFVDDIGLTGVTVSTDPWCNGVPLTVTMTFTNATGSAATGESIRIDLTSNLPTASRPVATSASDGGTITDDIPDKGFGIEWIAGAWPNGGTLTRSFVMTHSGCTPGVSQITSQVYVASGYICAITWSAVECP